MSVSLTSTARQLDPSPALWLRSMLNHTKVVQGYPLVLRPVMTWMFDVRSLYQKTFFNLVSRCEYQFEIVKK